VLCGRVSVSSFSFPTEVVSEGRVKVVVPRLGAFVKTPSDYAPSKAPVFYNPVMEMNRDLAVLALQAYQRTAGDWLTVCEPLAGCGIRGVRLAVEVEGVASVIVNDVNLEAYRLMKFNVAKNGLTRRVTVENEDANFLLSSYGAPKKRFSYVDIDPFGSPMPFVDSALRALRSGGMLALTATDLGSLCGVYPKACERRYGGTPLRTEYCHELAVRLLAGALAKASAKYEVGIDVAFSHSSSHYVRLYAVVSRGARKANSSLLNMGYVLHCFACLHRETVKEKFACTRACPECGSDMAIAGPLWLGETADRDFLVSMRAEARSRDFRKKRDIRRLLTLVQDEARAPVAFYVVDSVCDKLDLPVPSIKNVVERLRESGFEARLTHFHPRGFKTDAPAEVVKEAIARPVSGC
jgi:tRNA (guanine26-N2/guanine27-N2)-dimethyltransferase